jgi:dipeptidyl aminopeptidase/acylaminoacyl peptidase
LAEQTKRAITVDDLTRIKTLESPQVSPDGTWVAYVLVTPNPQEKGYTRNICIMNAKGGDAIQVTRSGKDSSPSWSPDGKTLAFVSARAGKPQIYLLPWGLGGEARPLTSAKNGAMAPAWSPDGTHIAFLARNNDAERQQEDSDEQPEPPKDDIEANYRQEREKRDNEMYFDPMFIHKIPYRQGTSYMDDRTSDIYVIPVDETLEGDEAKARRLTNVDANYAPPKWLDDGTLITARTYDIDADEPWRRTNLYRINVADGAETRIMDETHSAMGYEVSPDGKHIAAVCMYDGKTDYNSRLLLYPVEGGEATHLNAERDRSIAGLVWNDAGLFVQIPDNGDVRVEKIDPETHAYTTIVQGVDGSIMARAMDVAKDGMVFFVGSTPRNPSELYRQREGNQRAKRMTDIQAKFLDEVIVNKSHEIHFTSPSGDEIQGWYILPDGYEEGKQYPLALNIHGGPHVMWSNSETSMWHEWQLHAARGYVVFFCNPRGGDGYGEGFQRALHADWGDVAMMDIMAGVDLMIEKGFVDEKRMALTGGSYGGYMTAWIVGHTQRFAAAVTQRGVYNLVSFYGTSDVPMLISNEFDAEPWENQALLWEHSPLAYAHHMKTPLLIIHAENDFRVPIEQGEQLFAFVRRSGGTTKLIRYPREGHELSRSGEPAHRISRLTEMVDWFDAYCMPEDD